MEVIRDKQGAFMKINLWNAILLCASLASCSSVPALNEKDAVTITDIIVNVRCEFQAAATEAPFLTAGDGYTVGADIQLQVVNGYEYLLDSSYAVPLSSIFVPELGVRMAGSADATRSVGISLDYSKPDKRKCEPRSGSASRSKLLGNLGFAEWAKRLQETYKTERLVPNKAAFTLEFVLERSAGAKPALASKVLSEHVWRISPKISGSSKHVHRILIVLTKNDPPVKIPVTLKKRSGNAPSRENQLKNDNQLLYQGLQLQQNN
jgi:hypothetical protein